MSPCSPYVSEVSAAPDVFELRSKNSSGGGPLLSTNQFERSPSLACTSLPVTVTVRLDPLICTLVARPPSSPSPLRAVTANDRNVPTLYFDSTDDTGTCVDQLWNGERTSPSSWTAGNVPPAVHPPVDDENSVRATL